MPKRILRVAAVLSRLRRTLLCGVLVIVVLTPSLQNLRATEYRLYGIDRRTPWTTSRLVGSPEPPLPYTVEKSFAKVKLEQPMFVIAEPGTERLFVVLQGGETNRPSRILELANDPNTKVAKRFLTVTNRIVYSFTFHPGYRTNGYIYVFSNGPTPETNRLDRISRFTVSREAPFACDPHSEFPIIEWRSMGHDGGGLGFGRDGMFYISTGDGTTDSDEWVTGQDLGDLLGGILRIDVDHTDGGQPYSVPADNPFVGLKDARPELWAYGLRNPWRLAIDEKSGQIWAGNNGQDLWETAHLIRRGENYGWSVYEGSHSFYPNRKLGPTTPVAPTVEHSHSEARSMTGGVVYRGSELSELDGAYIYGDFSTGKIWGARHDGERVTWHRELASTELQITAFTVDQRGELLIADYTGGIYRLVRAPAQTATTEFPKRLSATGLFVCTDHHQVQPGVVPYSINAAAWADGASAERFIALPEKMRAAKGQDGWTATNGAVLVQTLSLELEPGNAASRRRIETRVLLRDTGQWHGYTYRWDEAESDATLVAANGDQQEFTIRDSRVPGESRKQIWHYPSRAECTACHSRAANFVLGMSELQLNRLEDYGDAVKANQLRTFRHIGLFPKAPRKGGESRKLADPYDASQDPETRARSYLHVNCSVCHVGAGGGNSRMQLSFTTLREQANLIGARPQHDTFGIANAMVIAPGDPERSVLYQRLSRRGRGQMPPVVINTVDEKALAVFHDWISKIEPEQKFVREWTMEDLLPLLERTKRGRSFVSGQNAFRQAGCSQCHKFAGGGGGVGPDLSGVARRLNLRDLLESIVLPSKVIAEGFQTTEVETESGESISGRVIREDDSTVLILPTTISAEAIPVRTSDIRRRILSQVSNMPNGILNTLQQDQILDLLIYLVSDGNANNAAFVKLPGTK